MITSIRENKGIKQCRQTFNLNRPRPKYFANSVISYGSVFSVGKNRSISSCSPFKDSFFGLLLLLFWALLSNGQAYSHASSPTLPEVTLTELSFSGLHHPPCLKSLFFTYRVTLTILLFSGLYDPPLLKSLLHQPWSKLIFLHSLSSAGPLFHQPFRSRSSSSTIVQVISSSAAIFSSPGPMLYFFIWILFIRQSSNNYHEANSFPDAMYMYQYLCELAFAIIWSCMEAFTYWVRFHFFKIRWRNLGDTYYGFTVHCYKRHCIFLYRHCVLSWFLQTKCLKWDLIMEREMR